uniref:Uncharacterized protein n=1 Tax=Amphilophus citrinellus TaxID=61819 RepID=A0A3Q0S8P2_AMPCI
MTNASPGVKAFLGLPLNPVNVTMERWPFKLVLCSQLCVHMRHTEHLCYRPIQPDSLFNLICHICTDAYFFSASYYPPACHLHQASALSVRRVGQDRREQMVDLWRRCFTVNVQNDKTH